MSGIGRRRFLGLGAAAATAAVGLTGFTPDASARAAFRDALRRARAGRDPEELARDERYWGMVARCWRQTEAFTNLENGYYNPTTVEVLEARCRNVRAINEEPSFYMRRRLDEEREEVRQELARFAGAHPDEVAIVRNTTEALNVVIMGMPLERGDVVIHGRSEYPSMREALAQRAERDGIVLREIELPLVATDAAEVVARHERAIDARTKAILISHVINLTGQVLPVRAVAEMARERGVVTICDAAHSFAHLDYRVPELGCDYVGTSLHKWLGAPLGTGMLWMRRERIAATWPLFGDVGRKKDDIRKFEHIGTSPPSAHLGIRDAIRFNEAVGRPEKEARLRHLKDSWTSRAAAIERVVINTPRDRAFSCGIGNFRIEGMAPRETERRLMDEHGLFTVAVDSGVRVSPNLYTRARDLDRLVAAIRELAS